MWGFLTFNYYYFIFVVVVVVELFIVEQNRVLFDIAWYFAVLGQLAG